MSKAPLKCGKCGAKSLYREDDRVNKASYIACLICGNRWPGGIKPVLAKMDTVKKLEKNEMKRGTCSNCKRDNQLIATKGMLCAGCNAARARAHKEGKYEDEALKAAAERFQKMQSEHPSFQVKQAEVEKLEGPMIRAIAFSISEDDEPIYQYIVTQAKANRRTIEAQILYMIESYMRERKAA